MSSPDTPADRAYVAARLTQMDHQFDQARAAMMADLDTYRDDFTTRHQEQMRSHQERAREIEEQTRAFLTSYYDNGDEGTQDVQQTPQDASGSGGEPATPGPGSAGQPSHEAEMAEAARIQALPMSAWAEERQRLIRANRGLFSQEIR